MKAVTKIQVSKEEVLWALTALVRQSPAFSKAEAKEYEIKMLPGNVPGMELTISMITVKLNDNP